MNNNREGEPYRIWTKWNDRRTPEDSGTYRFRVAANVLGVDMVVEWSEKQRLHTGCPDDKYLPSSIFEWTGWKWVIIRDGIEWSVGEVSDSTYVLFHGLGLLPDPFTGGEPRVLWCGRYGKSAPFDLKWIGIESYMTFDTGWTDANKMRDAWNTRTGTIKN